MSSLFSGLRPLLVSTSITAILALSGVVNAQTALVSESFHNSARMTSIQNQPMSTSVLSGVQIGGHRIGRFSELSDIVPSLSVRDDGPSQASFGLRGLGIDAGPDNQGASTLIDGAVGIYLDGAAFAHPYFANIPLFDVDHVVIAQGGQTTLFGRAASAGAISVRSNFANFDETFYDVSAAITGQYDSENELSFIANIVATDQYAFRIALRDRNREGSFQIPSVAVPFADANDINDQLYRVSATLKPVSDLVINFLAEKYTDSAYWGAQVNSNSIQRPRAHTDIRSQRLIGHLTYRFEDKYYLDVNGAYHRAETRRTPGTIDARRDFSADMRFDRIEWGVTVRGTNDFLAWRTGINYQLDQRLNRTQTQYDDRETIGTEINDAYTGNYGTHGFLRRRSYEYFIDLDFNVHDIVNISTGARQFKDDSFILAQAGIPTVTRYNRIPSIADDAAIDDRFAVFSTYDGNLDRLGYDAGTVLNSADYKKTETAYYASIDVKTNDGAILYLRKDRSIKAGGYNEALNAQSVALLIEPQINDTYELGYKSEWLGRRLRFNVIAFRTNIKNYQSPQREMITGVDENGAPTATLGNGYIIRNVGNAELTGIEINNVIKLRDDLELQFEYQYLLDNDFDDATLGNTTLPFAPNESYLLGVQWHSEIEVGRLEFGATWARTSLQSVAAASAIQNIPDHISVDVRAQIFLLNERLRIGLIGKNLTDDRSASNPRSSTTLTSSETRETIHYGEQYLLEVGYRF